jgi:hypothetical protein
MARLTEYNYDTCLEICERVSNGENIKNVLASNKQYPSFPTWCRWKRENDELHNLYTRSIQNKAESLDAEIENVLEEMKAGELTVPQARVILDTLKWKMSKYYPKMFGDKLDITTDGDKITKSTLTPEQALEYLNQLNDEC